MSKRTELSPRTVQRTLRDLEAAGSIIGDGSKGRKTTRYTLAFNPVTVTGFEKAEAAPTPSLATANPVTGDRQPRHSDTQTCKEPKKEEPEGRESARATPTQPDLIQPEGKAEAQSPERPSERPPAQPAEARPPEHPPADADRPPPGKMLGNKGMDDRRRDGPPPRSEPLPDDWIPLPEDLTFALSRGLDPQEITLAFCAHYRGNGEGRANWSQVFRSWCLRERKMWPQSRATRAERDVAGFQVIKAMAADLMAQGIAGLPKGQPVGWRVAP
jgi:hypothetical protein